MANEQKSLLSQIQLTDVASITVDYQDDTIAVKVFVPVGDQGELAEYEETYEDDDATASMVHHARQLGLATVEAVKARKLHQGPVPCSTCTGACCYNYDAVHLTAADVAHLSAVLPEKDFQRGVEKLRRDTMSGHVAVLTKKPRSIDGEEREGACYFLRKDGCSIYENRPTVCREYSAWTCEIYEPDSQKTDGKVHLRVTR